MAIRESYTALPATKFGAEDVQAAPITLLKSIEDKILCKYTEGLPWCGRYKWLSNVPFRSISTTETITEPASIPMMRSFIKTRSPVCFLCVTSGTYNKGNHPDCYSYTLATCLLFQSLYSAGFKTPPLFFVKHIAICQLFAT